MVAINNAGRTDQLGKSDMRRYDTTHHIAYHRLRYEGVQGSRVKQASITLGTQFLDDQVRRGTCADFRILSPRRPSVLHQSGDLKSFEASPL